jgi:hypothetical protein
LSAGGAAHRHSRWFKQDASQAVRLPCAHAWCTVCFQCICQNSIANLQGRAKSGLLQICSTQCLSISAERACLHLKHNRNPHRRAHIRFFFNMLLRKRASKGCAYCMFAREMSSKERTNTHPMCPPSLLLFLATTTAKSSKLSSLDRDWSQDQSKVHNWNGVWSTAAFPDKLVLRDDGVQIQDGLVTCMWLN